MSASYSLIRFRQASGHESVSVESGLSYAQAMQPFDNKTERQACKALAVVKDFDSAEPALLAYYCHSAIETNIQTLLTRGGYHGLAVRY